ncbi:MAG: 50S ribosomal protein L6 [Eubacteriales bacterium]
MSRVGKKPIVIPSGVEVIKEGNIITVKGQKGSLVREFRPEMNIAIAENIITVTRSSDIPFHRSLHGLTRTLISNMIEGVSNGYSKRLELVGVGYRAALQGKTLVLTVGKSHPVEMIPNEGIEVEVPAQNRITVKGMSKELVGLFAANIRDQRPPEPYKGKGIRYEGEKVRHKEGKTGAK